MLERHVYYLITERLSLNHPLANTQWGFQSGKSTVTALLITTYDWLKELEAGKEVYSVFLDIRKAFDSVLLCLFVVHMHVYSRTNNCPLLANKFCP